MLYGIFSYGIALPRIGLKTGRPAFNELILDLEVVGLLGYFSDLAIDPAVFTQPVLNDFIALGRDKHRAIHQRLAELLTARSDRASVIPRFGIHRNGWC